jgi:hypothetical protein
MRPAATIGDTIKIDVNEQVYALIRALSITVLTANTQPVGNQADLSATN